MGKTARDIMSQDADCVQASQSILDAAKELADRDVGAMPICGDDDRLKGMLTDRDIVVKVLAQGKDPSSTKVSELAEGKPVTIGADDDIEDALDLMKNHQIRRLPVIEDHLLVGIISQADIALSMSAEATGETVEEISE